MNDILNFVDKKSEVNTYEKIHICQTKKEIESKGIYNMIANWEMEACK